MTGYEKSPDYGDPHPEKGWRLRVWAIVYLVGVVAVTA